MTSNEAFQFLDSLIDYEKTTTFAYDAMKLDRFRLLLSALGNPQDSFQSIHVAGSRGKGSTCAMVYSILREAGFTVGLYTSPHLIRRNERIRLARGTEDREIDNGEFARWVLKVKPAVERLEREGQGESTFFEVLTAISFLFFKEKKVDFAILEVGMGGRLDATNVAHPLVAAITPISFDHTDKLGTTLSAIAREKAQILKRGASAVIAYQEEEPLSEIRKRAEEVGVIPLEVSSRYAYEIVEKSEKGSGFHVIGKQEILSGLFLPLLGEHQVQNALVAITICDAMREKGFTISHNAVRQGLSKVVWPGRFQILEEHPALVVDGAQNGASALVLKETFLDFFKGRPLRLILGISANKEVDAVCRILCPLAEEVVVTQARSARALEAEALKGYALPYSRRLEAAPSVEKALERLHREAGRDEVILVTGSLYLVGEVLALTRHEEVKMQRSKKQRFFSVSLLL